MTSNDIHQYTIAMGDKFKVAQGKDAFRGVQSVLNLGLLSSPFDADTIELSDPKGPEELSKVAACTDIYNQDEVIKVGAEVTGSYGAFSASLSSNYEQDINISEVSSVYLAFWQKSLGTVYINQSAKLSEKAKETLKTSAKHFIERYGTHFISAYELGAEFVGQITVRADSLADKIKVDVAVSADYANLFSAKGKFEEDLANSEAHYHMSVEAQARGTTVNTSTIASISDMHNAIDNISKKLDQNTAIVTKVVLGSWLALPDVADNVKPEEIDLFHQALSPDQLDLYAAQYEKIVWMDTFIDDTINDLDDRLNRQWLVNQRQDRLNLLNQARDKVQAIHNDLAKITEKEVAASGYILDLTKKVNDIQDNYIKPALKLVPFKFKFNIAVSSEYDDYRPKQQFKWEIPINPNYLENRRTVDFQHPVDNQHANCRHFYGHMQVNYTDGTEGDGKEGVKPQLTVYSWWNRVCGSTGNSNTRKFSPLEGKQVGVLEYDDTIRVNIDFTVDIEKLPTTT